jgi:hypothetical protein
VKRKTGILRPSLPMYERVRRILDSARSNAARSVNTTQVVANWLIGREIVEEEQAGQKRAGYGEALLQELSMRLAADFGNGYSAQNLRFIRQLYLTYPRLLGDSKICYALRSEFIEGDSAKGRGICHAVRSELKVQAISDAMHRKSWKPGTLHPNLSWTHYRTRLRVDKAEARAFYEIEAIKNNWAARELERQINSLLYERLALSRDKNYGPDYKKIHFPRPLRDILSQFVMPAEPGIQSGQIIEKIFQR